MSTVTHKLKNHFSFGDTAYIFGVCPEDVYRFMESKYKVCDDRFKCGVFGKYDSYLFPALNFCLYGRIAFYI